MTDATGSERTEQGNMRAADGLSGGARIVVGVDGSDGSLAALAWAVDMARLSGASVHLVLAWQMPEAYGPANIMGADPAQNYRSDWSQRAQAEAERLTNEAGSRPDVHTSWEVVEGHAAPALLSVARANDLLVVGSRGYGGFVGALLGSVSQHVVSHAVCPVVVVPGRRP